MSLRDLAVSLNSTGVEFMEGREKAEEIPTKQVVNIKDFDFLHGDDGEFAVFVIEEDKKHFFFGGSVITEKLQSLNEQMSDKDWDELRKDGIPTLFEKRKSKNMTGKKKREYMTCTFYPEEV